MFQERVEKAGLLQDEPRAFIIFEGACPDCFADLVELRRGQVCDRFGNPAWFEFRCTGCGEVHFVEQVAGGDWATS